MKTQCIIGLSEPCNVTYKYYVSVFNSYNIYRVETFPTRNIKLLHETDESILWNYLFTKPYQRKAARFSRILFVLERSKGYKGYA